MKKLLIATIVIFTVMAVSPVNAGHHYRHHHRHHSGHHHFWGAWAIGALTGALIASLFFIPKTEGVYAQPTPPPAAPPLPMSPGGMVSPENGFGRVSVEIYALNVRSGPGLQYAVTGYVCRDDILVVYNHLPGWLYVQLPSGHFGWIMPEFTTPVTVSASR